ncbi:hypothetical protein [Streptomyces hydrogenans]|uniref:hypothetical protein n=1 Tax=Streptomyces hydrogenans TaxID=1873719 RepID=UPI003439AEA5
MTPPAVADVLAMAADQVLTATRIIWPDAIVVPGPVVPSVTSYVQQLHVDGRPLYAKLSVCGTSLVSVTSGACGDFAKVRARQAAYLASPGSLMAREAQQLRALSGPAQLTAAPIAGYARGVLLTAPVTGPTLADLIETEPGRTRELLALVVGDVTEGLARDGVGDVVEHAAIRERGIADTFSRKFNGPSGPVYLRRTGHGQALAAAADRLRRARRIPPGMPGRAVIFGDLKPEHAVFFDNRPVYLDPGLMRGHAVADTAKLASRIILGLIARRPAGAGVVLNGIDSYARAAAARLPAGQRSGWLRELVALALMDTLNILSTYLTAPADLPLSAHAAGVRDRARHVADLLDRATAPLAATDDGAIWWRLYLTRAREAVAA